MADQATDIEGNRAWLIERIRALAPALLPPEPTETTAQLRELLGEMEAQRAAYRDAGFVDLSE